MNARTAIIAALTTALLLGTACSGPRAFTRGTYEDPNVIEMLSDDFNENDLQLIAKKMVESLSGSPALANIQGQPVIVIGSMKNSTAEHINMKSLADKMLVQLQKTGKFAFTDKDSRPDVADEYEYQGSGYVDPSSAAGKGQQVGAQYMMTGEIASITQEVGGDKRVYYKMTTKLHDLRTNLVVWADEKEIAKRFEKKAVTW